MFAFLPYICFAFIFLVSHDNSARTDSQPCWRSSFLGASVAWAVLLTAITELLGATKSLTPSTVLLLWSLATVASALTYFRVLKKRTLPKPRRMFDRIPLFLVLILVFIGFNSAVLALIALVAAPDTYDGMVYHMPRVVHWIQNHSVSHYPTHTLEQLFMPPWAEFHILHLQILSGGDRLAALPQWFSMIGCLLGVSLITKELGGNTRAQIFAAVFAATIPMGVLQATITKNGYVLSFWLVCFAYYVILLTKTGLPRHLLPAGAAIGLALLTKATGYIYAFPFLLWCLFCHSCDGRSLFKCYKSFLIIAIVAVSLNVGHYYRNMRLFGSPLGIRVERTIFHAPGEQPCYFTNGVVNLQTLTSNVIRNLALHIGTPERRINRLMERAILGVHTKLGVDVNDPRTTRRGWRFRVKPISNSENFAGNPIHLLLILTISLAATVHPRFRTRTSAIYMTCVVGAFLLFCLYLKWQPFHSRLHLPLFVLYAACVGLVLGNVRREWLANSVMVVLLISSLWWVWCSADRPLLGKRSILTTSRQEQFFGGSMGEFMHVAELIDMFRSGERDLDIGLVMPMHWWEYLFWVLLKEDGKTGPRIEHVNVRNISRNIPLEEFDPDVIMCVSCSESNTLKYYARFGRGFTSGTVWVFGR